MLICSGIFTSLITFLNSFFSPSSGLFFFSFNLALLTEAKLLCLISISSTFKALEIVNSICTGAEKISFYGYSQDPAKTAVTPTNKIFASVYLAQKGR